MPTLTKPINKIYVVKEETTPKFLHNFNQNKASREFLESCGKAGELFGKKMGRGRGCE